MWGPLFEDRPAQTTTGPIVVRGIHDHNLPAIVRCTESMIITSRSDGTELEQFLSGEKTLLVVARDVEAGANLVDLGQDDVRVN